MSRQRKLNLGHRYNRFTEVAEEHGVISPLIQIGQFKENCTSILAEDQVDFHKRVPFTTKNLSQDMGVSEDVIEELKEVCSPSTLTCQRESEMDGWDDPSLLPEETGLVTIEHWKDMDSNRKDTSSLARRLLKSKYTEMSCAMLEQANSNSIQPINDDDVVQCPELVITVTVFFPRDIRRFKSSGVDFLVLGSQKLIELRDRIPCAVAQQPIGNFTDNPDHPTDIKLKDICTSSAFYIENTFFNDMRAPSSIDLSSHLIEWASKFETIIAPDAEAYNMEDVTFNELFIRVGCPYIFLHLGDCEHIVIFKDIKLFDGNDCQSRSAYPITTSRANFKGNPCEVCSLHLSTWVTLQDELAIRDPALFCDKCFRTLHYDRNGNKLGHFIAYPRINILELEY